MSALMEWNSLESWEVKGALDRQSRAACLICDSVLRLQPYGVSP